MKKELIEKIRTAFLVLKSQEGCWISVEGVIYSLDGSKLALVPDWDKWVEITKEEALALLG